MDDEELRNSSPKSLEEEAPAAVSTPASEKHIFSSASSDNEREPTEPLDAAKPGGTQKLTKLKESIRDIERHLAVGFGLGIQEPFCVGSTPLASHPSPDGKCRKYLHKSAAGHIALSIDQQAVELFLETYEDEAESWTPYELHKRWMNFLSVGDVEVLSRHAGAGRRKLVLPNESRGYHMASLGPEGFVLARSGMPLVDSENRKQMWLPSLLSFKLFQGVLGKSQWELELPFPERIASVGVGSSFVAVLTCPPQAYLRVFSLSGVLVYVQALQAGWPICVACRGERLLVVEQEDAHCPWLRFSAAYKAESELRAAEAAAAAGRVEWSAKDRLERGPGGAFNAPHHLVPSAMRRYRASFFTLSILPACDAAALHKQPLLAGPPHLIANESLVLFADPAGPLDALPPEVDWAGFTEDTQMPVLGSSTGALYSLSPAMTAPNLFPAETSHTSFYGQPPASSFATNDSNAVPDPATYAELLREYRLGGLASEWRWSWVPLVSSLYEVLGARAAAAAVGDAAAAGVVLRTVECDTSWVTVNLYRGGWGRHFPSFGEADDPGCVARVPVRAPLLLPPEFGETAAEKNVPVALTKWLDYLSIDPNLSEQPADKLEKAGHNPTLHWAILDELRTRLIATQLYPDLFNSRLLPFSINETDQAVIDSRNQRVKRVRKFCELLTVRSALRQARDGRADAALFLASQLSTTAALEGLGETVRLNGWHALGAALNDLLSARRQLAEVKNALAGAAGAAGSDLPPTVVGGASQAVPAPPAGGRQAATGGENQPPAAGGAKLGVSSAPSAALVTELSSLLQKGLTLQTAKRRKFSG